MQIFVDWVWQQLPNILCLVGSLCFTAAMILNMVRS